MTAWDELEITLYRIYEEPISIEEKILGIVEKKPTKGSLLRNWLTFILRQAISDTESKCFYAAIDSLHAIRKNFHKLLREEVFLTSFRGSYRNKDNLVDDVLTYNSVVCDKTEDGTYKIKEQLFFSEPQ